MCTMPLELPEVIEHITVSEIKSDMLTKIVTDIKERKMTILSLVEGLSALLSNPDKEKKKNGVEILSLTLSQLPRDILNTSEITVLMEYYCGYLTDHHSLIPLVLKGVLSLVTMETFPSSAVQKLYTIINIHFVCQSQEREDRLIFYKILFQLIYIKYDDLLNLGPDFVFGVLSAISGEKDAVNLLYLFKNLPKFFSIFPLGHLTEDAFEVISCYFPVDYEGSENINREELAENLNNCLVATEDFVESTINLAIDKLSSTLKVAKMDSLTLLKLSFNKFKSEKVSPFIRNIIYALWQEIRIGNLDEDVENEIQSTVVTLITSFNLQEESGKISFQHALSDIYKSVHGFLTDVNFATFTPAMNFLLCVSKISIQTCEFFANKLLPVLAQIKPVTTSEVILLMKAINRVIKVCYLFSVNPSELQNVHTVCNEIRQLFTSHIETCDPVLKTEIIRYLSYIISTLDKDDRIKAYSLFYNQSLLPNGSHKVRKKSLIGLKNAAKSFPEEVESFLIVCVKNEPGNSVHTIQHHLTVLCTLSVVPNFVAHLYNYINIYMVQDNMTYVPCVIQSLKDYIVSARSENEQSNKYIFSNTETHCHLINYLCDTWLNTFLDNQRKNEDINGNLAIILVSLISVLETEHQIDILKCHLTAYLNMLKDIVCTVIIIEGLIGGVTPNALESFEVSQLCEQVIATSIYVTTSVVFHSAGRIIVSIFNKIKTVDTMQRISKSVRGIVLQAMENDQEKIETREHATLILAYVIKGLLFREAQDLTGWLSKYLDYTGDANVGKFISEGFKILLVNDGVFLNDACYTDIRPNYKYTLFNATASKLLDKAKESSDASIKSNCMRSLACQLLSVNCSDIHDTVNKAIPQFVEMLNADTPSDISLAILKTFRELLRNSDAVFKDYATTLLPDFLQLAKTSSCVEVRICSLECLYYYAKYETYVILPHKSQVLTELTCCLSDRKRMVRREAASTRCIWYTVGL